MAWAKDFRGRESFLWTFVVALVRRMTAAATAAVTIACLFTEWLCYVMGRLHSSLASVRLWKFKDGGS